MGRIRKRLSAGAKARVAIEAVKSEKTLSEIANEHQVHPNQVSEWRKTLTGRAVELFERGSTSQEESEHIDRLYRQIGELQVKLEWVKKNLATSTEERRMLIEPGHASLSIAEQCTLLSLPRSSYYYEPIVEAAENLELMRLMDELHLQHPFYGSRQMSAALRRVDFEVNRKRVQRLMRLMGIEAMYPKPRTSIANSEHRTYPSLLDHTYSMISMFFAPIRSGALISYMCRCHLVFSIL